MPEAEIYERLNPIFRDVIGDDSIKLEPQTTAEDIDGWDSVTHISLIVSIELEFKIDFKASEMETLKNVAEMVDLIQRKTN